MRRGGLRELVADARREMLAAPRRSTANVNPSGVRTTDQMLCTALTSIGMGFVLIRKVQLDRAEDIYHLATPARNERQRHRSAI